MLGVPFPDNAHVSVKKDGTIEVRSTNALETRYEVSIRPNGDVVRARFCSSLARRFNITKKNAPEGIDSSCLSAFNCYDYLITENTIKDKNLLDHVRFLISIYMMFPGLQMP
jgi:hypothetical protein